MVSPVTGAGDNRVDTVLETSPSIRLCLGAAAFVFVGRGIDFWIFLPQERYYVRAASLTDVDLLKTWSN
jgi:hypothetical protein